MKLKDVVKPCPECGGWTSSEVAKTCKRCKGKGYIVIE